MVLSMFVWREEETVTMAPASRHASATQKPWVVR